MNARNTPSSRRGFWNQPRAQDGIALIVVMILVLSMAVIAGAFAFAMRVETRVSMRTQASGELEWLGRSGVELARWALDKQRETWPGPGGGGGQFHTLNQFWAGGPGPLEDLNSPYLGMSLKDVPVGEGRISVEIVDAERKLNINTTRDPRRMVLILEQVGMLGTDGSAFLAAINDWIDPDNNESAGGGAEKSFYLGMDPPYVAKNGPIDDISELLKIKGVTPQSYWGSRFQGRIGLQEGDEEVPIPAIGLVDLFCAVSGQGVNVNTAPRQILQVIMGGDPFLAGQIVEQRAGLDGVDGTLDDNPFRTSPNLNQLLAGGGQGAPGAGLGLTVLSSVFEIRVTAEIAGIRKRYFALLRWGADRMGQVMVFHPDE